MNRYFLLSMFFGVLFFMTTLVGCSTPADYYERVQSIVNEATPFMKVVDGCIEKGGDPSGIDATSQIQKTKEKLEKLGAYNNDSTILVSAVALMDFYMSSWASYSELMSIPDLSGSDKDVFATMFRKEGHKAMLRVMKSHDEFAKKYELMHGMMVAE